jgi:anti-sigma B factor antagonist
MDWVQPAVLDDFSPRQVAHVEEHEGRRVVAVTGSLDLFSAPSFERELVTALGESQEAVVVDLTHCDFLDSGALAVIVRRQKLLDSRGARLVFVAPQRSLIRLFALTHLNSHMDVYVTRAEALIRSQSRLATPADTPGDADADTQPPGTQPEQ